MAQVTLYLDEEIDRLMRRCAEAAGVSNSRWVAELIKRHAHAEWPPAVAALAGRFPDFPDADQVRTGMGEDTSRVGF